MPDRTRVAVYTALFGGYDQLQEPTVPDTSADFICFTDDRSLRSRRWRTVYVTSTREPAMMNRHIKMHPHLYLPDHEVSIYVDANLRVVGDPAELADRYLADAAFAAPRHQSRTCVYDEITVCVESGKADRDVAERQAASYRAEGYPAGRGLTENRVLVRRHHDASVVALMTAWWAELITGIPRDQTSLQVVAWRLSFPIAVMDEDVVCGDFVVYQPHGHDGLWLRFKIHLLIALKRLSRLVAPRPRPDRRLRSSL